MATLSSLRQLPEGWDGPGSRPVQEKVSAIYEEFISSLGGARLLDAEPMATHDGGVRMEWDRGDVSYVAEFEATGGMYMCAIGDEEDVDLELGHVDLSAMREFFETGAILA